MKTDSRCCTTLCRGMMGQRREPDAGGTSCSEVDKRVVPASTQPRPRMSDDSERERVSMLLGKVQLRSDAQRRDLED